MSGSQTSSFAFGTQSPGHLGSAHTALAPVILMGKRPCYGSVSYDCDADGQEGSGYGSGPFRRRGRCRPVCRSGPGRVLFVTDQGAAGRSWQIRSSNLQAGSGGHRIPRRPHDPEDFRDADVVIANPAVAPDSEFLADRAPSRRGGHVADGLFLPGLSHADYRQSPGANARVRPRP